MTNNKLTEIVELLTEAHEAYAKGNIFYINIYFGSFAASIRPCPIPYRNRP